MQGIPYFYVMNVIMKEKYEKNELLCAFFIIFPYTIMQIYGLFSSRRHIVLIISNSNQRCDVTTFRRIAIPQKSQRRLCIQKISEYLPGETCKKM